MLVKQSRLPIRNILAYGWLPSPLKIAYYRMKGAKIGKDVSIGLGTVIMANDIVIGDHTTIGFGTILRGKEIYIGAHTYIGSMVIMDVERIRIGDDAKINEQVYAGGPMFPDSYLSIGSRTTVMQHTFLNPSKPLIIKDGAGVGGRCSIFTHSSWQNMFKGYPVKFAPIEIGEDAWIPWDVFIMPGVRIGDGATVGAGSLVIKDIPARSLAAGVPAKVLRTADEYVKPLSHDEQARYLADILNGFTDYLIYHNYHVRKLHGNTSYSIELNVSNENNVNCGKVLVRLAGEKNQWDMVPPSSTIVSLDTLLPGERDHLSANNCLWVDIPAVERGGKSNRLGEQLVEFLKRYGVHLRRC